MKLIFMGTPDFSAVVLEKLNSAYPVAAVVTGLDKPVGRGHMLKPCALKVKAEELGIPVLQYAKASRDGIDEIRRLTPDIIVTAAFGQILSDELLSIPKHGVLNVHASLLPKYRGSAPIQWAILNGDEETGVTIMRTVSEVDAGDILLLRRTKIGKKETAGELFDRLALLGGDAIVEAVRLIEEGRAEFIPQDHSEATHCSRISKEDGEIDFTRTAAELDCFVRGMTPWPSAFTHFNGKLVKIFDIEQVSGNCDAEAGVVVYADSHNGLVVKVGEGLARITSLQLEGARRMSDVEFLRGRDVPVGARLGR